MMSSIDYKYTAINNFDDSLATLDNIVIINENNDDSLTAFGILYINSLTTRQGAAFDDDITTLQQSKRPSDRRYYTGEC